MQVSVNLVGILQEYYPAALGTAGGPVTRETDAGTTVRSLLAGLGIPEEEDYFIMVNGDRVDHPTANKRLLEDRDAVVLIPVIKGG